MTEERRPFAVGDEVADCYHEGATRIARVARVARGYVVLDDGTKWRLDGYVYPKNSHSNARIVHVTDAHRAEIMRRRIASCIGHGALTSWPWADLAELYRRLKPETDATGDAP